MSNFLTRFWNMGAAAGVAQSTAGPARNTALGGMSRTEREAFEGEMLYNTPQPNRPAQPPGKGNPWNTLKDWPAGGLEALIKQMFPEADYQGFDGANIG